jgi:hypothetical protein
MANDGPLLPRDRHVPDVSRREPADPNAAVLSTRDHEVIWKWARARDAEPATGEESESGPASAMKVADGGSGLRFNFPAISRFRRIKWSEWFEHFDRHELTFVYDRNEQGQPTSSRYRLVRAKDWDGRIG